MDPLPIDTCLPEIVAAVKSEPAVVLTAPAGAGKTTRVPRALFDGGLAAPGEIVILEPRRLATRLAARRVAAEMGQTPGGTVGYSVRFEQIGSAATRIRFVTEGILSRRIVQDPELRGVAAVILDEFHERHLTTDLALSFLRQLQQKGRPDLKMVVMSATLDAAPLAAFLGNAPIIRSEGTLYDVRIDHEDKASDLKLEEKTRAALLRLLREGLDGDVLVFLPGAAEIRKTAEALSATVSNGGLALYPLHGDLPAEAQEEAIRPSEKIKIILSTNVAETSVTIPGIAAVIDSGLARAASHSSWSGLPVLQTVKISRSSAAQRAGRAGRTRNGRVIRLYTKMDFESRPEHDIPEIRRSDLAETLLMLHGAGIEDPRAFPWFEPPPTAALDAAEEILIRLGALDVHGSLTSTGRSMLRFPLHPRLARLIVESENRNCSRDGILLAALLGERDIRSDSRTGFSAGSRTRVTRHNADSDLLEMRDSYREAEKGGFEPGRLRAMKLDRGALDRVRRAEAQLVRLAGSRKLPPHADKEVDEALQIAILSAFPDRVARRRSSTSRELLLSGGGSARLADESGVHKAELMAALDVTERRGEPASRTAGSVWVRLASAIEPEWIADLFPEFLIEETRIVWNEPAGRVDEQRRTTYGQVVLEEKIHPAPPSPAAAAMLAEAAIKNPGVFPDQQEMQALMVRLECLSIHYPDQRFPSVGPDLFRATIERACIERTRLADLKSVSLCEGILAGLAARQREILRREAPERIMIHPKRTVKIHYESGRPPWIESRLQDFIPCHRTPAICGGRLPLTLHLLAPNGRPVQVTRDLTGFWKKHYPAIRKELQRRYPKHPWPDPEVL